MTCIARASPPGPQHGARQTERLDIGADLRETRPLRPLEVTDARVQVDDLEGKVGSSVMFWFSVAEARVDLIALPSCPEIRPMLFWAEGGIKGLFAQVAG